MRKVDISHLKPGMKTAQAIHNQNGQVLMNAGVELTEPMIDRLRNLELVYLYVDNKVAKNLKDVSTDCISRTQESALQHLDKVFHALEECGKIDISQIHEDVRGLIDELLNNQSVLAGLYFISNAEEYAASHAVEVTILSLVMAINLGYSREQLMELGMGALLHDIGMVEIDQNIVNKQETLKEEEYNEVQLHAECGFDILQQEHDISMLCRNIALQHHERWNGSGYPAGLKNYEIHEYARLVAIADVFSALTSDRPHRRGYSFDEAVEYITTMSGYYFDSRLVNGFLDSVRSYTTGSFVLLSTGDLAQVVDVHWQIPTRPTVRLLVKSAGGKQDRGQEINLYREKEIDIKRVLTHQETVFIRKKLM